MTAFYVLAMLPLALLILAVLVGLISDGLGWVLFSLGCCVVIVGAAFAFSWGIEGLSR